MPISFDETLGTLFIGYIMSTFLLGISACQVYIYSIRFPNDALWVKALVWAAWMAEPIHFVGITQFMYNIFVNGFGNILKLLEIPAGFHVATMMSVYISVVTESFLIYRIWKLSRNHLVVIGLSIITMASAGLHLAVNIEGILKAKRFAKHFSQHATLIQSGQYRWLPLAETSIAAGLDVLITVTLCWILRQKIQTGRNFNSTTKVVEKLILWTMETGLLTSALHLAVAISYAAKPSNYMWLAFWFCTSRCYANSLLAILNGRSALRNIANGIETYSLPSTLHITHGDSTMQRSRDDEGVLPVPEKRNSSEKLVV